MAKKIQHSTYRQRGYECPSCKVTLQVFGNDVPSPCLNCGGTITAGDLKWDHLIHQKTTTEPYFEN